ncbi:hypothetical protein [Vibrio phage VpKK5]|uniref:hypothetical protein n=1 Tax=Vibrio phage VpKK5 TaxID=1538804 RepID=UPI0004F8B618|nr:hypothetical protein VC55_gp02 [Vibrio phage VpKK5]AIM40586.1 hypothetical protein [Vibrio phage VpKK5]UZT28652.1 hypothetical protein pD_gene0045 [Vibrio phage 033B]
MTTPNERHSLVDPEDCECEETQYHYAPCQAQIEVDMKTEEEAMCNCCDACRQACEDCI